ncbi:hypothetical protein LTR36_009983 [Oleoguttula mirabilis]|uniref:Uncharacterized protein n=1 Tax=Oleoguttula mirabilis TaxID=1507867 RepID=A0AAV9J6D3_9PEZI|nr:hypothetical protein LTR36_009983 [Oleoguttula mirabilis]
MSRYLKVPVRTPQSRKQADHEEATSGMGVNDSALLGSSPGAIAPGPGDGRILHLGSDLPDVPAQSGEAQTPDLPSNRIPTQRSAHRRHLPGTSTMGASNSHEEISAALRATAAELKGRTGAPKSDGKLKRPSTGSASNKKPAYKAPVLRPLAIQRRMGPTQQARADPYDIDASPEKSSRLPTKHLPSEAISPRKKQKKTAKQVPVIPTVQSLQGMRATRQQMVDAQLQDADAAGDAQQEIMSSPRRSRRRREAQEQDQEQEQEQPDGDESMGISTQSAHEKTWFRDAASSATRRSALRVEVNVDEQNGEDAVGNSDLAVEPEAQEGAARVQADAGKHTPLKRKPGRPRKSAMVASSTPISGSSAATNVKAVPETARKQAASKSAQKPERQNSTRAQRSINARQSLDQNERALQSGGSHGAAEDDTIAVAGAGATSDAQGDAAQAGGEDDDDGYSPGNGEEQQAEEEEEEEEEIELEMGDDDRDGESSEDGHRAAPQKSVSRRLDKARPSEVFGGATGPALPSSSPEKQESRPKEKRKRSTDDETAATANTSKKRRGLALQSEQDAEASERSDPEESVNTNRRLYGQWPALRKVFKAVNDIGVNHVDGERQPQRKINLRDADIIALVELCDDAVEMMSKGEDSATKLLEIATEVDALYEEDAEHTPDFKSQTRIKNIYAHLFPKLLELLRKMITTYETADGSEASARAYSSISFGHLRTVYGFIRLITDLGDGLKKYDSPPTELALVSPVKNKIVVGLKKVYAALRQVVRQHNQAEEYKAHQQREAEERALATQREEQEERRAARVKRARKEWQKLHEERIWADCGIAGPRKKQHLKQPDPEPEVDDNGVRFERVEVFTPRIGPTPAMVEAARQRVWSMLELDALREGLRKYSGPDVFVSVFRKYCHHKTGVLTKYNVTEIVTTAADLREYLASLQQEQSGEVEDWVKAIPVWTKGHPLGKENSEGDADDDDGGLA